MKNEKVAGLNSFDPIASVVHFIPSNILFHDDQIIEAVMLNNNKIEKVETGKDFKDLKADPTNMKIFRNMIILSSFAFLAILSIQQRDAGSIA